MDTFLTDHDKWVSQMRAAIVASDAAESQRLAHMTKGAAIALDELERAIGRLLLSLRKFTAER